MKKLVMRGMFAFLLVSGVTVHAEGIRPASDEQTAAGERVDCFYEYNQSNPLCQKVKDKKDKPAGTSVAGKASSTKTVH